MSNLFVSSISLFQIQLFILFQINQNITTTLSATCLSSLLQMSRKMDFASLKECTLGAIIWFKMAYIQHWVVVGHSKKTCQSSFSLPSHNWQLSGHDTKCWRSLIRVRRHSRQILQNKCLDLGRTIIFHKLP